MTVAAKPKSRDMFRQSGNPPGAQPSGSEGGKGAGVARARASRRNRRRILAEEDLGQEATRAALGRGRGQGLRWIAWIVVTTGTTTGPQGSARGKTHRGGRTNPKSLGGVAPASPTRTRRRMARETASAPRTAKVSRVWPFSMGETSLVVLGLLGTFDKDVVDLVTSLVST